MNRLHLFEFEDQSWFPKILRNYTTDFLRYLAERNNSMLYQSVMPVLERGLRKSKTSAVIDLASGAGGPWLSLAPGLKARHPTLKITLTDYFPNTEAMLHINGATDYIHYAPQPIDARRVPASMPGLRTQFLSFHHFKPSDARRILQNAIDSNNPIAIIEDQERSLRSALREATGPIKIWQHSFSIKPLKAGRIFFTYVVPILPFTFLWDGIVSCLRTYSPAEMNAMIDTLKNKNDFDWETGRIAGNGGAILYLLGTPKRVNRRGEG